MGRVGIVVELAPLVPAGFVPPDGEAWEALEAEIWQEVHEELERRMPHDPEAEVLAVIDDACMIEGGCTPGRLEAWCRDDLPVASHAAEHWYRIGLALLANRVRARVGTLGYRVVGELGDPEVLASEPGDPVLRARDEVLALVNLEHEEVQLDDEDEEPDADVAEDLLADVRGDPRCGCALCAGLRG